jgi:uncharacterized protein (DUF433 family)
MITTKESPEFKGVYIAPEAAIYLSATLKRDVHIERPINPIRTRNLIHWIRVGLMTPELKGVSGAKLLVSFEDLISMRVIAILRALGVSWAKIHKAEEWLRKETEYPRPFAIERVWTETTDVFAQFHEGFVAASRGGQLAFTEVLGKYLQSVEDMVFIPHNGVKVAGSWMPHEEVIMTPTIQFGEPCIRGTRVRTRIIQQYIESGDAITYLMRAFDLTQSQVEHALEWEHRLRTAKSN